MEWLAIAIVVSACLYLIDKNQKWKTFRRILLWGTLALALFFGTYMAWESVRDARIDAQAKKYGGVEVPTH